jgi:hypothetical protein
LSTGLNSLANNAQAITASPINLSGDAGFRQCEAELLVTFGTNPTANTSFCAWILKEIDGANYEDGSASITPTRVPDLIFTVRAVTTAQRIIAECDLPPGSFYVLIRNDGTGQAIASSGNTLKIRPKTESW